MYIRIYRREKERRVKQKNTLEFIEEKRKERQNKEIHNNLENKRGKKD